MDKQKSGKLLALLNIAFFIGTVVVNALANTVRIGGRMTGEISDSIPNLFVPAGITFAVWGVIYLLLLAFAVYQARLLFRADEQLARQVNAVGIFFIAASACNIGWIFAWHYRQVGLSLVLMLALFASLAALYRRLRALADKLTPVASLCLKVPFSVYLGWISVALIANVTAALVTVRWDGFGLGETFWTIAMIAAALIVALAGLFIRRDIAFALVFIWAFLGIFIKRSGGTFSTAEGAWESIVIAYAALIACLLAAAGVIFTAVRLLLGRRKEAASAP